MSGGPVRPDVGESLQLRIQAEVDSATVAVREAEAALVVAAKSSYGIDEYVARTALNDAKGRLARAQQLLKPSEALSPRVVKR